MDKTKERLNLKLKCSHCGNVWNYKGTNPFKATCSYCGWKITITKCEVKEN